MARYLITSALPYINGIKHLGNLAGSMLPADVQARFRRLQGHEVLFICATDEHGTPAELAAAEAGMEVRAYCDAQYQVQKDACDGFRLSFDWFGRSSNPPNHKLTQTFCEALEKNGLIEERVSKQIYSIDDRRFLPDRYVEGTCPNCAFERARGDQCDNCGTLLDPIELKNPRSKISGSTNVEPRDTAHLFLKQPLMQERIRAWVDKAAEWPPLARSIAYKWLDEGLIDRSITRDLAWGIKVTKDGKPRPGFENKVFYVWFDAPIGYIASTWEWCKRQGERLDDWWKSPGTEVHHFIGKDITYFHTLFWPGMLKTAGFTLPTKVHIHGFLTVGGEKMSKSKGTFVTAATYLKHLDPAWLRYFYASKLGPRLDDLDLSPEEFVDKINSDLVGKVVNLASRTAKFVADRGLSPVYPDDGGLFAQAAATAAGMALVWEVSAVNAL